MREQGEREYGLMIFELQVGLVILIAMAAKRDSEVARGN